MVLVELFNFSNFTAGGILRLGFDPYTSVLGNVTWGIIFGFIGAGIYANQRSLGITLAYLIGIGAFFGLIFPEELAFIFGLLLTFIISIVLYVTFVQSND